MQLLSTPATNLARCRWAALLLSASLALFASPATSQRLQPTPCAVLDAAGRPVADAAVTILGSQPHLSPSLRQDHLVELRTDARGRALARLRPGLCYVAWARGPAVEGRRCCAPTVGFFAAGASLELRCEAPAAIERGRLLGADAWRDRGPLRCFAMSQSPGAEIELRLGDDGRFELPGPPYLIFEARLADGQPLWSAAMDQVLQLPPPQRVVVRARDGAGQPLSGAAVTHVVSHSLFGCVDGLRGVEPERVRRLGVTDARGRCEVVVPYEGDPLRTPDAWLLLAVDAGDRPPVFGGAWWRRVAVDNRPVERLAGDELPFTCALVEPLRGAVAGAPAGTVAHLSVVDKRFISREGSSASHALTFTAEVRADGSFAFVDVPHRVDSCRLSFVPPAGARWRPVLFAPEAGRALPAAVRALDEERSAVGGCDLALQVLDPNGLPARGAVALLFGVGAASGRLLDVPMRIPLDPRGSASVRVVAGEWLVSVLTADGFGYRVVEVAGPGARTSLQLDPLARTTVTLLDARGAPVVGARVQPRPASIQGTRDPVRSILQRAYQVANTLPWRTLRTDADGRVEVPFAQIPGVRRRVGLSWGGARSGAVDLVPDAVVTAREAPR